MTKQELIKLVERKLAEMIENQQVGYLQICTGLNGKVVIHKHITEAPFKVVSNEKKVYV